MICCFYPCDTEVLFHRPINYFLDGYAVSRCHALSERTDWGCYQWIKTDWSNKCLNYVHSSQFSNIFSPHKDSSENYSRRSLPFLTYMLNQQWTIVTLSRQQELPKLSMDLNYLSHILYLDKWSLSVRLVMSILSNYLRIIPTNGSHGTCVYTLLTPKLRCLGNAISLVYLYNQSIFTVCLGTGVTGIFYVRRVNMQRYNTSLNQVASLLCTILYIVDRVIFTGKKNVAGCLGGEN